MKIIQWTGEGKIHFYFQCFSCNCERRAEKTGIKITYSRQNLSPLFSMDCPNCGILVHYNY